MSKHSSSILALSTSYSADQDILAGLSGYEITLDDAAIAFSVRWTDDATATSSPDGEVAVPAGASYLFDFGGSLNDAKKVAIKAASGTPNATLTEIN